MIAYGYDGDKLISYNGTNLAYDEVGNPLRYRNNGLTWTKGRQLSSYSTTRFEYDGQGRRTKKNSIVYTYDSRGRLIKSSDGLEFIYDVTGLTAVRYGGTVYTYAKDLQGNIVGLLDSQGHLVVEYFYDAWGNHIVRDDSGEVKIGEKNPFRYRGYYYDVETGFYYLQSRYYDPEVGRFITIDNIDYADPETINGLNLYAYCNNNPVMFVDHEGLLAISISLIACGAAFLALFGVVVIEVKYHPIQKGIETIVEVIGDLFGDIKHRDDYLNDFKQESFENKLTNKIRLSREKNRGHDSGFIGLSDDDLIELLQKAKSHGDSKMVQRLLKEMKMRGMRNARKNRNNPHMRGWFLLFWLLNRDRNR